MKQKLDTRAIGLDVGLAFIKWLTGKENLHYGLWTGLDVSAGNLRAAQEAYTDKLFALLPEGPLRILDIGGGAGETAGKLLALGHSVEIVVPSAFLAGRCRENAPGAQVHQMRFEEFESDAKFDLCLFSESFQYIPLSESLPKCAGLLKPRGHLVLADCFRSEDFGKRDHSIVGGGHGIAEYRSAVRDSAFEPLSEEDVTTAVAPSVDLEQDLFNVFGLAITRVDDELSAKRPRVRWLANRAWRLLVSARRRERLTRRLTERTRTADVFIANNVYLMAKLRLTD
jgi:MPBQ/MSBQ methyltransferase